MNDRFIVLEGRESCVIVERRDPAPPAWRWWGPSVGAAGLFPLLDAVAPASFSLDEHQPLELVPSFGEGWLGTPALLAHRDGRDFAQAFELEKIELKGAALTVLLHDPIAAIAIEQRLVLDPESDVLSASAQVENRGTGTLTIDRLAAATLPLPSDCKALEGWHGRHTAEYQRFREPMPAHAFLRENRSGLTGHAGPPGLFVLGPGAGWHAGRVHAAQLAWSGNHRIEVTRDQDGFWTLQLGEGLAPGEVRLEAGQRYVTPEVLATCTPAGRSSASQNFHAVIRARAKWPGSVTPSRPVHLNSWEGFYFDHDEACLIALADRAAALGVERFVLDDGWFRRRDDDRAGLGDWTADMRKYPRGLGALADHAVARGMEFGLWVEPEMVNPDSDLARQHPDWVLGVNRRSRRTARHQLVLDLGRTEVRDHLFDALDALLRELPIAYLKWDHNRDLCSAGGADGHAGYHAQVLGAYALIDRLRAAHPSVSIEACAGGGGRNDAGIAARADRFWVSDNIDAVSRVEMQRGFLAFFPPEMMGAHVGAAPAHVTGRGQGMAFRCAVALPGHFGVELDPAELDDAESAELAAAITRYKALRGRLHSGRTWLGEGPDGLVWQMQGEVGDLLLLVTRIAPSAQRHPPMLVLPPLATGGRTRVRLLWHATDERGAPADAPLFVRMRGEGVAFEASWLAEAGLPLPPMKAESALLFALEAA